MKTMCDSSIRDLVLLFADTAKNCRFIEARAFNVNASIVPRICLENPYNPNAQMICMLSHGF